jgi:hypothetical protein
MMTLTTAISRVANRLNKNANDTTVTARIKNEINDACQEKWHGYPWSFRWREYPLVLSAKVTSGTMTATNGSHTVTASGTPFVVATHKGAWIRFTGDTIQAWYRVATVSSTSVILIEPAYQGTDGSGKAYELCKTDYLLPLELSDLGSVKVQYDGQTITPGYHGAQDPYDFPPLATGSPVTVSILKQDRNAGTYTTGTLSGTVNTVTITGAGTSWLDNVSPGDELDINGDSNTYRVFSVDSDTQLTLYNKLQATAAALTTYTISRQFGHILRVWPVADNPYVLFLKGLRAYAPLINNADSNELLVRYPQAVQESAVWREAGSSPDPREDGYWQRSEFLWAKAQGEDEALLPRVNRNPIWDARQQCR